MSKPKEYRFPFGQLVERVEQVDRTPKKVFILTYYTEAVYAALVDKRRGCLSSVIPVANEPVVNWTGGGAKDIIKGIPLPDDKLVLYPSNERHNGRRARQIDDYILTPLGYSRADAWYCRCNRRFCRTPDSRWQLQSVYAPLQEAFGLPQASIPRPPNMIWKERREAITEEFSESRAERLIAIGNNTLLRCLIHMCDNSERLKVAHHDAMRFGDFFETHLNGHPVEMMFCPHPCSTTILHSRLRVGVDWYIAWLGRIGYEGLPPGRDIELLHTAPAHANPHSEEAPC